MCVCAPARVCACCIAYNMVFFFKLKMKYDYFSVFLLVGSNIFFFFAGFRPLSVPVFLRTHLQCCFPLFSPNHVPFNFISHCHSVLPSSSSSRGLLHHRLSAPTKDHIQNVSLLGLFSRFSHQIFPHHFAIFS